MFVVRIGAVQAVRCCALVFLAFLNGWPKPDYFTPAHQLSGIGVARDEITPVVLAARTERMIESQTFSIMREPQALPGAERVLAPRLLSVFESASRETGIPAATIEAIAYLESWGNPRAESPAGPKGIMQFSEATARAAGLSIVHTTRYKVVNERVHVKRHSGRTVSSTVRHRVSYSVLVRDDRFSPERAIPAAAHYLARLETKFGGRDWAIFAYHCGEGCVADLLPMAQQAAPNHQATVASMFFAASPVRDRALYEALERHMQRDYSPTYWFRIRRAEQLLELYETQPNDFRKLVAAFRNDSDPTRRADHRLQVWLKGDDLVYRSGEDLRRDQGSKLVRILDEPEFFNFEMSPSAWNGLQNRELYLQASPSTVGTLAYIAFETRRLFDALHPHGTKWTPLRVSGLVSTLDDVRQGRWAGHQRDPDVPAHCTGQVFDLSVAAMSAQERQCLEFILDEMGWDGYLGFKEVSGDTIHMGCAPSARDFFAQVYQDAASAKKDNS